jgi:hypothetical protein
MNNISFRNTCFVNLCGALKFTDSSSDENIIQQHCAQLIEAGVGVAVVSWYPVGRADEHGCVIFLIAFERRRE